MSTLANRIIKHPSSVVTYFKGVQPKKIRNTWVKGPANPNKGYARARNMVLQLARTSVEAKIKKEVLF